MNFPETISANDFVLKQANKSFAVQLTKLIQENQKEFKYLDFTIHLSTQTKAEAFLLSLMQKQDRKEQYSYFLFQKNILLGYAGIKIRSSGFVAELSYYLDKNAVGKGYITQALRFLETLFFEQGGHRTEIFCNETNLKSCAVAKRLGYRLDGVMREYEWIDGGYTGVAIYSKIKGE